MTNLTPATAVIIGSMIMLAAAGRAAGTPDASYTDAQAGSGQVSSKTQWDGVFTEAQAARGEALYVDNCIFCHGTNLTGTVLAPAVAGPAFMAKWNRRPLSLVFNIIQTQMPLNLSGHLSPQQNADVLAYMLQKSGSPTGPRELPGRTDMLSAVTILEKKP